MKVKLKLLLFLIDLTDNSLFKIIVAAMFSVIYIYVRLCICEKNDTRNER